MRLSLNNEAAPQDAGVYDGPPRMSYLDSLQRGQSATIVQLDGDDASTRRLMELGLLPGEPVELVGRAPLGDPIAILIRGARIAVRVSDARRIHIKPSTPN